MLHNITLDMPMCKSAYINKGKLTIRTKGISQGSLLIPLLSNIMYHDLDYFLEYKKKSIYVMPTTLVFRSAVAGSKSALNR